MSYSQRRRRPRHDGSPAAYARDRRQRRAEARVENGRAPTLAQVADHERLIATYQNLKATGGAAPGVDGVRYSDLGRHEVAANIRMLSFAVEHGLYRPALSRTLRIEKANGTGHRTLALRVILDRVVSSSINTALTPLWESIFLPSSYGFRPRRSHHQLLADMLAAMTTEERYVLAIDDVRNAFNNVPIPLAMDLHRQHLQDTELLDLIERVLRGGEHQERAVGIAQGDPYSPTVLNVVLHDVHDLPFARDHRDPLIYRYADNLVYLCTSVPDGQQALDQSRALLTHAGLALKGEDGPPIDLRDGGKVEILGFTLRLEGGQPRLGLGKRAWTGLGQDLLKAHESTNPPEAARAIVRGWLDDRAPAFEGSTDTAVRRTRDHAARLGFRELSSQEELRRLVTNALGRWQASLRAAYQRVVNVHDQGLVDHVGAPPPTVLRGVRSRE